MSDGSKVRSVRVLDKVNDARERSSSPCILAGQKHRTAQNRNSITSELGKHAHLKPRQTDEYSNKSCRSLCCNSNLRLLLHHVPLGRFNFSIIPSHGSPGAWLSFLFCCSLSLDSSRWNTTQGPDTDIPPIGPLPTSPRQCCSEVVLPSVVDSSDGVGACTQGRRRIGGFSCCVECDGADCGSVQSDRCCAGRHRSRSREVKG